MLIPRSLLDELTREVGATSGAGRRMVAQALSNLLPQFTGDDGAVTDVAGLRDAAIALMEQACSYLVGVSAGRAAELYDAVRALQAPPSGYSASVMSGRDPQATAAAVRAIVQKAVDGRLGAFVSALADRADYEVRRAANECVALNAARDPAHPRYGRVPMGAETCGFCMMLASFGFHWRTAEAASHAHAGCDCRVVPDFGGAEVDGYDPDGMYGRYQECLSSIGGRDGVRAEWDALPEEERSSYIARHGRKAGKAFDAYVSKRVAQEIESRDPEWFSSGKVPSIEFTDKATEIKKLRDWKRDPGERQTADVLRGLGFRTTFWDDELHIPAPDGRGTATVGRPDLDTGVEIKSLDRAASENTLDASRIVV